MYPKTFMYLIISSTVFAYAAVDLKDFYPFGELNGDTVLPSGENQCGSVIMKFPSHDGCNKMIDTEFYISTDGVISTNKSFCSFSKGIPPISRVNNIDSGWAVAPFLTLTSTATFGTVQFRESYDIDILRRVNKDISHLGLLGYNATNALIATWIDVTFAAYTGDVDSSPKNSFQALVTSNGYYAFAIFYYNKITWIQGDYNAPCTGDTSTGISYICQGLAGYVFNEDWKCLTYCADPFLLNTLSNVNRPGIWIARTYYNTSYKGAASITPAYLDMMGHRSLKVMIPESLNCSTELMLMIEALDFNSNCHITSTFTSHDLTELSCFGLQFTKFYGSYFPLLFTCDIQFEIETIPVCFEASVFLTPPVPEVYINVLNISVVDYSVSIELKWNAPLIAEQNPGCETVNISMHIFNPNIRIWNDSILIMESVNNSGDLYIKLVEPITGLFLTKHLLFGVTGNVGPYATDQNTIFSKMFVFDFENFNLKQKTRSLRNANVLATVDMMGHRKLNISYRTTPGHDELGCQFEFGISITQAIASADNQYVICYVPFLYGYGYMHVWLVTGSPFAKTDINNDFQFQRKDANNKHSLIYKTKTKLNDNPLLDFYIDVLPSYPRLAVEQVGTRTESNGQFQVQMQFTWDPSEIPSEYPVLNAFIYKFDDKKNNWMKELMVSSQDIPPNAGSVPVTLSQEAIAVYFTNKVMFGLGYVQGDENFVILSKMYIPGEST